MTLSKFAAAAALAAFALITGAAAKTAVQIEYIKSSPGVDEATAAQVKSLHEELHESGNIHAYYDYTARFPNGASADYDRIFVTVFTDAAHIKPRNDRMPSISSIVKTEYATPDYGFRSPNYDSVDSAYTTVNFFQGDLGDEETKKTWRKEWQPFFDDAVDSGRWATWSKFDMPLVPDSEGYNFVIVVRTEDFASAEKPIEMISGDIYPTLVKTNLWRINNIVLPSH